MHGFKNLLLIFSQILLLYVNMIEGHDKLPCCEERMNEVRACWVVFFCTGSI